MGICHYLFWQEEDRISAVLNKDNSFEIIKFGGYTSVEYTKDYWEKWQEYAGFLKDDVIDFCFVFDNECPKITEYLKTRECLDNECIWDKYSIQTVADMMKINRPIQIYNEEGDVIAKTGSFKGVQESEITHLRAIYRSFEEVIPQIELKDIEMTQFIKLNLKQLAALDKQ